MNALALKEHIQGPLSVQELEQLSAWASGFQGTALEVGHYQGLSTCALLSSLRPGSVLWSIDHHQGDRWVGPSSIETFEQAVAAYRDRVKLEPLYEDFRTAIARVPDAIGFVFYDADHGREAVSDFWRLVQPKLGLRCVLLYDDADWRDMECLGSLAQASGFRSVRTWELERGHGDKHDPATNTLEVMARE